jgi:hypothetical protein
MPTVDPDPAGMGTYLVAAVLLALGIAIFLYILIREAGANRGREQDGREAAAETGAAPGIRSAASTVALPAALRKSTRNPALPCNPYCVCTLLARYRSPVQNLRWAGRSIPPLPFKGSLACFVRCRCCSEHGGPPKPSPRLPAGLAAVARIPLLPQPGPARTAWASVHPTHPAQALGGSAGANARRCADSTGQRSSPARCTSPTS